MEPVRVGIIGCGDVCRKYLKHRAKFPVLEVIACADLDGDRASSVAREHSISDTGTPEALLVDPAVEVVLNLTNPAAHAAVSLAAVRAGKHVYSEKPLAADRQRGRDLLLAADSQGVRVGCAPDTFLAPGMRAARRLIDNGAIGRPVGFVALMLGPGHEHWHSNPRQFYEPGGGPMFDMGPYYLTALVFLLGQPKRLFGMATVSGPERAVGEEQMSSHSLAVNTPDHVAGTIEFEGGATGAIMTSFCAWHSPHSTFTIFGTEGTLEVPDPNRYDGRARVAPKRGHGHWEDVVCPENTNYARGLGLADMAWAIRTGVPHRASGHLAFSILDMIEGFFDSRASGIAHTPVPCGRPEAAPLGWMDG